MTKAEVASPRRKGARRMGDIPPDVLAALNGGTEETITLVEWLAVDMACLARSALPSLHLGHATEASIAAVADVLAKESITARSRGMGAALHAHLADHPLRKEALAALATHRSDTVRSWAAYARMADPAPTLAARLVTIYPVAADPHMAVREAAWDALRPHIAAELPLALDLFATWVRDPDPRVRRCAIEGTRPRGVWTFHLKSLVTDPAPGLALLEPVRSDASDYVRRAVANWINDASKSHPEWARGVCARWVSESPSKSTLWIANRATRTLRKGTARPAAKSPTRRKAGVAPPGAAVAAPSRDSTLDSTLDLTKAPPSVRPGRRRVARSPRPGGARGVAGTEA